MRKLFVLFIAIASLGLKSQTSYTICGNSSATIVPTSTLSNPQYTLNPGNNAPANGVFVVTPTATTIFTIVTANSFTSYSYPVTVVVNPQPVSAPTVTNFACNTTTNAFNLNLTFSPNNPTPSYTISWLPGPPNPPNVPTGWQPGQTSLTGTIAPSVYTAVIVANGGCQTTVTFTLAVPPAPALFSLTPLGPTFSVTCNTPTVNISASNNLHTYSWNGNTAPQTTQQVALTSSNSGVWSVVGTNTASGCTLTRTFTLVTNTVTPQGVITPTFQNITCANPVVQTVSLTIVSPTINFTHFVFSPSGSTFVANTQTAVFQPAVGTYTYHLVNNATGCFTDKQFTVVTAPNQPTFNVISPQNFTLGCGSKSTAILSIVNASSMPTPGGALSYTFITPNGSTVLPVTGFLGSISTTVVSIPGLWTVVTRDNANFCELRQFVSVIQNTLGPSIDSVYIPDKVLTCATPQTTLQGVSETFGATYNWSFPGPGGTVNQSGSTLTVNANTLAPSSTVIATFTLTVTDPNNTCITRTLVPMVQNLFPPTPIVTSGGTFSLTCNTPSIVLTNQSKSNSPPQFPTGGLVVGLLWEGPSPQQPQSLTSTYLAEITGLYTLTVRDNNNGCTSFTTINVGDNKDYPLLNNPNRPANSVINCGTSTATLSPAIGNSTLNLFYSWTTAIVPTPSTNIAPGKSVITLTTNAVGLYSITVTNTVTGCFRSDTMRVIRGTMQADIAADHESGFAPLTVGLYNNSYYSVTTGTANSGITTYWSFGNGNTGKTLAASEQTTVVYNLPGTYTIVAYTTAGVCLDTAVKIIKVDIPSMLVVPNIFSPNGDGVNDIFFLQRSTNLSSITAEIYDRWGNKIYELTSDKGNIAWDGNNQFGKELPEGTYFYVIRATGRDSKDYDTKGTVTLVR